METEKQEQERVVRRQLIGWDAEVLMEELSNEFPNYGVVIRMATIILALAKAEQL